MSSSDEMPNILLKSEQSCTTAQRLYQELFWFRGKYNEDKCNSDISLSKNAEYMKRVVLIQNLRYSSKLITRIQSELVILIGIYQLLYNMFYISVIQAKSAYLSEAIYKTALFQKFSTHSPYELMKRYRMSHPHINTITANRKKSKNVFLIFGKLVRCERLLFFICGAVRKLW